MGVFFQLEAVFAPDDAWLVAVKADGLCSHLAAAWPALLPFKEFGKFQVQKRSFLVRNILL